MVNIDSLREQNPWWLDPEKISEDRDIRRLKGSPFIWHPSIIDEISFSDPIVYTLRGPRQVGKTTSAKMLVQKLLSEGINASRIMYYSLDLCRSPDEIVEVIRSHKTLFPAANSPSYYLFDEISSVVGWQKAIKYLVDSGIASDDWFLLTGSSATDIRRGAERLPGRRGMKTGLDKILLPMSFVEFATIVEPKHSIAVAPGTFSVADVVDYEGGGTLENAMLYATDLERLFHRYISVGGLPRAVRDYVESGAVADVTMQTYNASITSEIEKFGKNRISAFKLLNLFANALGSHTSWSSAARNAGMASATTAQEYTELMAEAFITLVLYCYDLSRNDISPKKNKKIYFIDPLFYQISNARHPSSPIMLTHDEETALAENMAAIALFRAAEREMVEVFFHPQHLFYWHSTSGKEIDFLLLRGKRKIPIEVKYQQTISARDLLTIKYSFGQGIVLSRRTLDVSKNVKILPLPLFLWVLRETWS